MKHPNLFQSYTFNNGVTVSNRLAVAPMTHLASDDNGHITDEERQFLTDRFRGIGLFISAATLVHDGGKAFYGQPEAIGAEDLPSLREVAQIAMTRAPKRCCRSITAAGSPFPPSTRMARSSPRPSIPKPAPRP